MTLIAGLLAAIFGGIVGLGVVLTAIWVTLGRISGELTPKPGRAGVHEPHDAEKEAMVRISESTISRLAAEIQKEAEVSPEVAREEAAKLVTAAETWGETPW